ncbi:DNA/RNA non-specific endonuclease [Streptomyces cacaoi]|uniref:DNA/RNA non-specific endonuclease n=1 Tax=Streptomyces cacaoi TaxID=1898 RepID=UPI0026266BC9|nr:DNA/RNA non-specific endonuclease [Streptomyces cacaoi]
MGLTPCDETDPSWGGRVQYGERDHLGRATGVHATLRPDMMGGRTDPQVDPAGWEPKKGYNRAHLLGAQLGGSNKSDENFVTMHAYANSPEMRKIETQVRRAVEAGETIQYSVTPIHDGDSLVPRAVTIEAYGSNGFQFTPRGAQSGTNAITILNVPKR